MSKKRFIVFAALI